MSYIEIDQYFTFVLKRVFMLLFPPSRVVFHWFIIFQHIVNTYIQINQIMKLICRFDLKEFQLNHLKILLISLAKFKISIT